MVEVLVKKQRCLTNTEQRRLDGREEAFTHSSWVCDLAGLTQALDAEISCIGELLDDAA